MAYSWSISSLCAGEKLACEAGLLLLLLLLLLFLSRIGSGSSKSNVMAVAKSVQSVNKPSQEQQQGGCGGDVLVSGIIAVAAVFLYVKAEAGLFKRRTGASTSSSSHSICISNRGYKSAETRDATDDDRILALQGE
jgi:hypothetical protein